MGPCLLPPYFGVALRRWEQMFRQRGYVEFGACVEVVDFLSHQTVFFSPPLFKLAAFLNEPSILRISYLSSACSFSLGPLVEKLFEAPREL